MNEEQIARKREYERQYRLKNHDRMIEYRKQYRDKNRDHIRQKWREWYHRKKQERQETQ